jgi:putative copper export protein
MLKTFGKKILLSFHILMISIWLGSLTSILFLQLGKHALSTTQFFVIDRFIFTIFDSVIMVIPSQWLLPDCKDNKVMLS